MRPIKRIHELGFDFVDFEMDAKCVVDNMINQQSNDYDLDAITLKCNCLLTLFFRNSHVKFVRRQANKVAHALARVTLSC